MAHNVEHGDIVVVGSDGLWDNLHRKVIVDLISPFLKMAANTREVAIIKDPSLLAELIAKEAEGYSYRQ